MGRDEWGPLALGTSYSRRMHTKNSKKAKRRARRIQIEERVQRLREQGQLPTPSDEGDDAEEDEVQELPW